MLSNAGKAIRLNLLASRMRAAGCYPNFVETSQCGAFKVVNAFNGDGSKSLMHPDSCTGLSTCQYTAALKALTEWLERRLVILSPLAFPMGTEGVAGWDVPTVFQKNSARKSARTHAIAEACERNIWSRWCDDLAVGQVIYENADLTSLLTPAAETLARFLADLLPGGNLLAVGPNSSSAYPARLVFCAYILANDAGVITGGSAAGRGREQDAIEHGMTELVRHALAYTKAVEKTAIIPASVYDRRLMWMASHEGYSAFAQRLANTSMEAELAMPSIERDEPVENTTFPFATFHRYSFKDHPIFIGSEVKRLCL